MTIRFDDRVAIITGAGNGLGREHALLLAKLGAKIVVNDLGGAVDGTGSDAGAAQTVVNEITAAGGEAIADKADVTNIEQVDAMVAAAKDRWGRVDIVINNAGILRDKSFAKMEFDDFTKVIDVHLKGTWNVTKAVWSTMQAQNYGRILMTSSSSGVYGNFGQSNYGAAKAAMIGLMNVLNIEGKKYDIRVNALLPAAATRMLDNLLPEEAAKLLKPELVAPGAAFLVSEGAPTKTMLGAGAGTFAVSHIAEAAGVNLGHDFTVDDIAANWSDIASFDTSAPMEGGPQQTMKFLQLAAQKLGIET